MENGFSKSNPEIHLGGITPLLCIIFFSLSWTMMFNEMMLHMANDKTTILVWLYDEELDTQIVKFNL